MDRILLICLIFSTLCIMQSQCVSKSQIWSAAKREISSTRWSLKSCYRDLCNRNKCNIFVDDVLASVGAKRPRRSSWRYSPIGANEWGNSNSAYVLDTGCYEHVPEFTDRQIGDVIAFPFPQGSGHVGIVSVDTRYISAREKMVEHKAIPSDRKNTIWRYQYTKNGC
ncbi:uncharacterized protein LOC133186036 [Saccostrea echinata]|uniref:uncharacterized protein LOC133186036 n=1 Tax=Saccostrea echinata TaxID=191078 RepID=UPI002A7FA5B3|nr:uncharacterized protein LOC133186036 [Saccostrea echinata]